MMSVIQILALGLAHTLSPQQASSTTQWADQSPAHDSMPAGWIATYPERARDSIRTWLTATAHASPHATSGLIAKAEGLAADYLKIWGDSFPLHDVRRFGAWPAEYQDKRVRADSLRRAGNAALGREGFDAASKAWTASLRLATEIGDTAAIAAALGNIGAGFYREQELDSATRYFSEARRLAAIAGDRRTGLNALGGLASVSKDRGDYRAAAAQYKETLALRRQVGDYRGVAADANNLGLVATGMGNIAEARRRHVEALITAQEHGFDDAAAAALVNLGALAANSVMTARPRSGTRKRSHSTGTSMIRPTRRSY